MFIPESTQPTQISWSSRQAEALLARHSSEQHRAGILGVYVTQMGLRRAYFEGHIDRKLAAEKITQAEADDQIEQFGRFLRAELPLVPDFQQPENYRKVYLGMINLLDTVELPSGAYFPQSVVEMAEKRVPGDTVWHGPLDEYQTELLQIQVLELDAAGLQIRHTKK